jgi:hypothetical protein
MFRFDERGRLIEKWVRTDYRKLPRSVSSSRAVAAPVTRAMGPVGFEPTTKGFTRPRRFRREWTISSPAHCSA